MVTELMPNAGQWEVQLIAIIRSWPGLFNHPKLLTCLESQIPHHMAAGDNEKTGFMNDVYQTMEIAV